MTAPTISGAEVRDRLRGGGEIALIDVRPEPAFARGHPLWAASLPLGQLELEAWERIPRRDVPLVIVDGDGLAETATTRLDQLGYGDVRLLEGGLRGWVAGGGELFIDVNVPSKAFGELVASVCQTPFLSPEELILALERGDDAVVVDVRRFDEYHTMSIPGATSLPGAELVHRIESVAPDPATLVVVNCAGRTRSIIGTQTLRNAGLPNEVVALRDGTIGWSLAGYRLDRGQATSAPQPSPDARRRGAERARALAIQVGVPFVTPRDIDSLDEPARTVYRFDVRGPEDFEAGHPQGFAPAPGGQLTQETDHFAPVRGARIVLAGDDTGRASATASWLAQMGWEVVVVDDLIGWDRRHGTLRSGPHRPARLAAPAVPTIAADELAVLDGVVVVDVADSHAYAAGHLPGATWVMRERLDTFLSRLAPDRRVVVTSPDGIAAAFAVADVIRPGRPDRTVHALLGGTAGWRAHDRPIETGGGLLPRPPPDRYRRPYEGTSVEAATMQAYLDWERGLVEQLARDGTHRFTVWRGTADEATASTPG